MFISVLARLPVASYIFITLTLIFMSCKGLHPSNIAKVDRGRGHNVMHQRLQVHWRDEARSSVVCKRGGIYCRDRHEMSNFAKRI